MKPEEFISVEEMTGSDHRPVCATFKLKTIPNFVEPWKATMEVTLMPKFNTPIIERHF